MAIKNSNLQTTGSWPFPDDNQSPKLKDKPKFHIDIARAIWGYQALYDTHLFWNDREKYRRYREYALGLQSEDKYKPFLNEENRGKNDQNWLKAINFQIKNYATKRVNIVVSKMKAKDYDPVVELTDPISRGILENLRAGMLIQMRNKERFKNMAQIFNRPEIADNIPNDKEELEIVMQTDFKMVEAIHLEKAIPYHLERNRFDDTRALMDFDFACLGVGSLYIGLDENLLPSIERINPADIIAPYNEHPNMEELPYIAAIRWVTVAQFRKMATGYLPESKIEQMIDEFARKQHADGIDERYEARRYDDVNKIAILHYNYKSTDTMVYLEKRNKFGNVEVHEKEFGYYDTPKELKKFNDKYKGSRKIHRKTLNAVYEGFWVIGSEDCVFRIGRRSYSADAFGPFNNTGMGFKVYAPNAWDGRVTSMVAQMIPLLDELQRYNLKVQQLVARAIPKGIGIDLYALRKANLKWGGKGMTDQQKIEMFMKSGIFVFSSKDRYAAGSNYRPFYEAENGLANDIDKYLRLTQNALIELDEIIGINKVVAASNIREDAGKAVTELQVGASEVALDYLYKADKKIVKQVVQDTGLLHIKSYKYSKANRLMYNNMFGHSGIAQEAIRFDLFDYGINIEARPTDEEWREIYISAEKAYDKGILTYSDTLFLREFKSIKQARLWLMLKEKKAISAANESKQNDIMANAQVQERSLQSKNKADINLENVKHKNNMELELAKRMTIEFAAGVELTKEQQLMIIGATQDRRENAQQGKIKDRHIVLKGEMDRESAKERGGKKEEAPAKSA